MKTFNAKPGLELVLPLTVLLGGIGITMAYEKVWTGLAVILLVSGFITHLFINTVYQVDQHILNIKCGFLVNISINIASIRKITETNNPISSPATSIDRLEIAYNRYDSVLISPKDKAGFIKTLKAINPGIEICLKKSRAK